MIGSHVLNDCWVATARCGGFVLTDAFLYKVQRASELIQKFVVKRIFS